ncbi:hypothetical protein Cri9333_3640 [Crinalium epipsammum PCC 9333]|uniref:Yip1 domain-containing protein n=1 Tax=Crinalium epipsammum PCC 9333 TaxID=1173022 RepID=K9W278_9CYAN|nr:YIP1 family protein [Crinalium epipsammum]AFZ14458.1 hypothetical protein Cri9333_3640 [Crinalium epipsammum PCC 9333]
MTLQNSRQGLFTTIGNALSLNGDFYENARNTPYTYQIALTIVILAAISHVLGSAVILLINRAPIFILLISLLIDGISVLAGYLFWTFTIWKIGRWLKRHSLSYGDLFIPIGYAYAPQALNFLTVIPFLGRPIEIVLSVWSLLAVIVAVRQGLDINTNRAALICLIGWPLVQLAIGSVQILEQRLVTGI